MFIDNASPAGPRTSWSDEIRQNLVPLLIGIAVSELYVVMEAIFYRPVSLSSVGQEGNTPEARSAMASALYKRGILIILTGAVVSVALYQLYRKTQSLVQPILYPPPPVVPAFSLEGVSPEVLDTVLAPPLIGYLVSNAGSRGDALALSQCNRDAYQARFLNPHMGLHFKNVAQVDKFWFYCRELEQAGEAALNPDSLLRRVGHLKQISTLSLDLSDKLSVQQVLSVFRYLPKLTSLNISIAGWGRDTIGDLDPLLRAVPGLKHLSIVWPGNERTPTGPAMNLPAGLWDLTSLETLTLRNLVEVDTIPDEIGQLQELKTLHLHHLPLRSLPDTIGVLQKLEVLEFSALKQLTHLPDGVGRLPNLISLKLNQLFSLTVLPDTLAGLPKLTRLELKYLPQVNVLPENIGELRTLRELVVTGLSTLPELPLGFWGLENLQTLVLEDMSALAVIPDDIRSLATLISLTVEKLPVKTLPENLWQLPALRNLELISLNKLTDISAEIINAQTLTTLILRDLPLLRTLPRELFCLSQLEEFELAAIPLYQLSEYMYHLTALTSLTLKSLHSAHHLPERLGQVVGQLKQLQKLVLNDLPLKQVPEEIAQLPALSSLVLRKMGGIRALPQSLSRLGHLAEIRLVRMREDVSIPKMLKGRVKVEKPLRRY